MRLGRPTPGIGHARGMKPICVEHRRACIFASLSFPCFVDSLRTRACMHACMRGCGGDCGDLLCEREKIRCFSFFHLSLFFTDLSLYIYRGEKKGFGSNLG